MGSITDPAVQAATKDSSKEEVPAFSFWGNAQKEFDPPHIANGNAFLGDVFSSSDINRPNPLSAGFYHLKPGPELVYTYTYDEMKILVEGEMQIAQLSAAPSAEMKEPTLIKEEVEATPGSVFFFPKGAVVRFRTRNGGKAWFCGGRARDAA
ncbi:MAG: hypothetical protein Q9174_007000 [Haloplaca sp. 1 TL-2023]